MSTPIVTHPEDPTSAMRQVRLDALKPQVSREAVLEVLQPLVLDTMVERTNTLPQAVGDAGLMVAETPDQPC